LKDNFILKIKDFERLTKDYWNMLNLPENLFDILKEKYEKFKKENQFEFFNKEKMVSKENFKEINKCN